MVLIGSFKLIHEFCKNFLLINSFLVENSILLLTTLNNYFSKDLLDLQWLIILDLLNLKNFNFFLNHLNGALNNLKMLNNKYFYHYQVLSIDFLTKYFELDPLIIKEINFSLIFNILCENMITFHSHSICLNSIVTFFISIQKYEIVLNDFYNIVLPIAAKELIDRRSPVLAGTMWHLFRNISNTFEISIETKKHLNDLNIIYQKNYGGATPLIIDNNNNEFDKRPFTDIFLLLGTKH